MSGEKIYEQFIEWLKQGFLLPDADELAPLIRARYGVEEAALLTGFPFSLTKLSDLAVAAGREEGEFKETLEALTVKDLLYRQLREDGPWFKLNGSFFTFLRSSFWAGRSDEQTKAIAGLTNKYYYHGFFDDWQHVHYQGLRALPINETIGDSR